MRSIFEIVLKRKCYDISFYPPIRFAAALAAYAVYLSRGGDGKPPAYRWLLRAHRFSLGQPFSKRLELPIRQNLRRWLLHGTILSGLNHLSQEHIEEVAQRSLVLKAPRYEGDHVVEKGVFFTRVHWDLALLCDLENLLQEYRLIIYPDWSGYADPKILWFCHLSDHPIIVMVPEKADYEFLLALSSNLVPIRMGSSDYIDPRVFYPIEGCQKVYDAVMVANWGVYKRHHVLFKALRRLANHDFRVALAGFDVPQGTREEVEALARWYGVADKVSLFDNLTLHEINKLVNKSKVSVLLSLREGANKAVFESLMAGVPCIVLVNNQGVIKDHINEHTGRLIKEHELAEVLLWFREHYAQFHPREWALRNISPEISTQRLNNLLESVARDHNEVWTRDIVAMLNYQRPTYYPDASVAQGFPTSEQVIKKYARASMD